MKRKKSCKSVFLNFLFFVLGLSTFYLFSNLKKDEYKYRRFIKNDLINNKVHIDVFFDKSGKRQGVQKVYHDNGSLKSLMNYENGRTDGFDFSFYDNGDLESVYFIKNDKYEGKSYYFHRGYKFSQKSNYKNGLKDGDFEYYDSLGSLVMLKKYNMSKLISKWRKDVGEINVDMYGNAEDGSH